MTANDYYEPIRRVVRPRRRLPSFRLVAGGIGAVALTGVGALLMRDGHVRGEPYAEVAIAPLAAVAAAAPASPPAMPPAAAVPATPAAPAFAPPAFPPAPPAPGQSVEIENGVTVIRPAAGREGLGHGPLALKVADALPLPDRSMRASDPRLEEATSLGPLPRISRDGARAADVYAHRPVPTDGKPAIAILVGGMGLDRHATAEAGVTLPGAVTFGFAPYGDDLSEQVRQARAAGHEAVLQMPMEGFGRPESALSHMLLVEGRNEERQHWLMSRFSGYAGIGNYLGGRLLADEEALRPILAEAAARGLFFVDDGRVPGSLALPTAADVRLPALRADIALDGDPPGVAAAFTRLEARARDRGVATGFVTGRPETLGLLAGLLAEAEKRGIVLVPVSQALALVPRSALREDGQSAQR